MKSPAPLQLAALAAAILLGAGPARACTKYEVRQVSDVAYYAGKDADRYRHKLDLYLPKGKKDYPVVVLVHGGAWMLGSKDVIGLYPAVGRFLAENGVGAALPNYRLSPGVKHPEHERDVARAFAWAHKNIAKYGGDPDKMFVAGHSAGGHLAALLGTDDSYLKAEGLSLKDVRGVMAISGVYRIPDKVALDLAAPDGAAKGKGKTEMAFNPFDFVFAKDPKGRQDASPVCHVRAGLPPFLVVYADNDLPLLPEMAEDFAKELKGKKCDVRLMKVKGRNHNSVMFSAADAGDPVGKAMLEFVAAHGGK